jgi:hypothetical protein
MRDNAIVIPIGALRRIFTMLLVVIVLIVVLLVVRTQLFRAGLSTLFAPGAAELIDRSGYQQVVLVTGPAYFGKLQEQGEAWFVLTDVFYLTSTEQSGTQLIKRGSEPQGPREPMVISKQHVLFIENLRDDSEIVTAIKRFKPGQLPAPTAPPATPARTTAPPAQSSPAR